MLLVLFAALALTVGMPAATGGVSKPPNGYSELNPPDFVTKIYIGSRKVGYICGGGSGAAGYWQASWNPSVEGAWVSADYGQIFWAGCGSFHDENRTGVARRRSPHLWTVSKFPQFVRLGFLRF